MHHILRVNHQLASLWCSHGTAFVSQPVLKVSTTRNGDRLLSSHLPSGTAGVSIRRLFAVLPGSDQQSPTLFPPPSPTHTSTNNLLPPEVQARHATPRDKAYANPASMADTGAAPPAGPAGDYSRGGEGQRGRGRGNRGPARGRGRGDGASPHRGGRGRGRGGYGNNNNNNNNNNLSASSEGTDGPKPLPSTKEAILRPSQPIPKTEAGQGEDVDSDDVCFICANPIQHHAVAPCNHITCHICALRMRALYKNKDCPHCRTAAPFVIFTDDASKRFDEYVAADVTSADENIGIRYTNEDIVGDTVLLLRYNCPDLACDVAALGWPDLHRHVRTTHHKKMCDLCTRNKKVFTHEHELFTDKELHKHMAHGDDKPGDVAQTGFRGHPLCVFCGERFYDDDKLYDHCRHKHERCFICDRRDSRTPHYYQNYDALEKHFKDDHYICLDRECLDKKFVVFDSEIDLKAHQLAEHGGSMSKDVRRDARVVDISGFDYRQPHQEERRGGRSGGARGGREARGRGRDPNAEALPRTSAQPLSRAELALQRQTQHAERAVHSAQSISTRTFGGQLTQPVPTPAASRSNGAAATSRAAPPTDAFATLSVTEQANLPPAERARLVRHSAVIERAAQLLGNDASKLTTFRSHISSFKSGAMTASLLIDAFFALFADTSASALGTLVREVAELFEDKSKADALRKAWQDWRAINEDYPSLPGLGGMHGATTSSSGWASAAAAGPSLHSSGGAGAAAREKHTTRVLKLKNSTMRGSAGGVPGSPGPAAAVVGSVQWANSAAQTRGSVPAATSSAAFPALPPSTSSGGAGGANKAKAKPASTPFWIGGGASQSTSSNSPATRPLATAASGTSTAAARRTTLAPARNEDAFPSLPAAPKMQTTIFTPNGRGRAVRSDFGVRRDTGFSWGGGAGGGGEDGAEGGAVEEDGEGPSEGAVGGGKGKKKKGKGKQVLVAWG